MEAHWNVVAVDNPDGKGYHKPIGLYNKHCKYSEQWNPSHPFQSAYNIQQTLSFIQETVLPIDQHLACGLQNFKIESCESVDAVQKLHTALDSGCSMHIWLKMIHMSSEHYTTVILANVFYCFWHLFHLGCTWIFNQCTSLLYLMDTSAVDKMSNSVKFTEDVLLARKSYRLQEQNIDSICT